MNTLKLVNALDAIIWISSAIKKHKTGKRQCFKKAGFILKVNETHISDSNEELSEISKLMEYIRGVGIAENFINIDDELSTEEESVDLCDYIPSEFSTKADSINEVKQTLKQEMLSCNIENSQEAAKYR